MSHPRVTELPNELTADLDVAATIGAVRLLGASDAGLFTGWGGYPGISSDEMIASAASLVRGIYTALRHASGRVVFSGCGTSGRLAHLIARGLNAWLDRASLPLPGRFDYLIAGADKALLLPQEAVEDQHDSGQRDLEEWARASGLDAAPGAPVVVIGISCGLSATYVASMLQAALARPGFMAVAVGFNSIDAVRDVRVDGWEGSFHGVLTAMLAAGPSRAVVLNPIVGPESIAGSSRMKGGSATKIVLETACSLGVYASLGAFDPTDSSALADRIHTGYAQYEATVRCVYNEAVSISKLVDAAAASLLAARDFEEAAAAPPPPAGFVAPTGHGRLLYVGVGTPGLLGIVDASECYPTYGSRFNDVHGFVAGGWAAMANKMGPVDGLVVPAHLRADRSRLTAATPQAVSLDLASFDRDYLPTLCADDTVVLLAAQEAAGGHEGEAQIAAALRSLAAARDAGARVSHVLALLRPDASARGAGLALQADDLLADVAAVAPQGVAIRLPELRLRWEGGAPALQAAAAAAPSVLAELAVKLVLNATTTVAHVQRGAIYGNRMVNVGITNAKLFHRAAGIVRSVTACSEAVAVEALLRSIYHVDPDSDARAFPASAPSLATLKALPVSAHVSAAAVQLDLVPVAVLLAAAAYGGRSLSEATAVARLRADPVVRRAVAAALGAAN